jgi:hypothetical protein
MVFVLGAWYRVLEVGIIAGTGLAVAGGPTERSRR